ncbi:Hypothetical predicted protein [Lecanosticta acicola]|uniref:Uncharacterized protein n=1 Tax=Lecanosticta acicola TaxID=111012 RepID=A0AAI8Z9J8_9PEZI|nr:Hypothetical predicted protein [Lecanosticta acicola]
MRYQLPSPPVSAANKIAHAIRQHPRSEHVRDDPYNAILRAAYELYQRDDHWKWGAAVDLMSRAMRDPSLMREVEMCLGEEGTEDEGIRYTYSEECSASPHSTHLTPSLAARSRLHTRACLPASPEVPFRPCSAIELTDDTTTGITKQAQRTHNFNTADERAMGSSEQSRTTRNAQTGTRTHIKHAERISTPQMLQHSAVGTLASNGTLIDEHVLDGVTYEPGQIPSDDDSLYTHRDGDGSISASESLAATSEERGIKNGNIIRGDSTVDGLGHSSNTNAGLSRDSNGTTPNVIIENRRIGDLLSDCYDQSMQLYDTHQSALDIPSSPPVHPPFVTPTRLPSYIDHFWGMDWTSDTEIDDVVV